MNRHLNILDYTLRSVFRRFSFHLSIIILHSAVIFLAASTLLTISSLLKESRALLFRSPDIIVQSLSAGRQVPIAVKTARKIEGILGVGAVRPRIWGYVYDPYSGANLTLWGANRDMAGQLENSGFAFREGAIWKPGERGKIILGEKVREVLKLGQRRHITLTDSAGELISFEIVGLFTVSSSLLTADLILMPEEDLRDFFKITPDLSTDIVVSVPNPAEIAVVAMKISKMCPSCRTVSREQINRTYEAVFSFRGGFIMMVWAGCLIVFLILLWHRGNLPLPEERKEIGILKAMGWGTADVLEMKILEASALSTASFFLGFFAAYIHVYGFGAALFKPILFGWSVLYPTFKLVPALSVGGLSLLFIITVFPYVAISLLPAWKSAATDAGELMREGR